MKQVCLVFAIVGCASEPADIHYTGEARRFVVDSLALPMSNTEARELGTDLNGDRAVDNQLGMVISTLGTFGSDVTTHAPDMIAAGTLASSVEIVADDFTSDGTVALRYFGADGELTELVGGRLTDGRFETEIPGTAIAHMPVFVDSDPITVRLTNVHVTLIADGRGGFDAHIGGAIEPAEVMEAAFAGVQEMFASRPSDHIVFFRLLDTAPKDFMITQNEFETTPLIESLLSPDITLDGKELLSIGFRVHLSPCADGRCNTAPPVMPCFDRVRDGNETDIDCGGSCGACAAGAICAAAGDCQSASCDGTCGEPSCANGVRDGLETDVDCGSECGGCPIGDACVSDADCARNRCGAPCSGAFCGDYTFDTCR